jgi:putative nucleotidyltransferase with HDIG domain
MSLFEKRLALRIACVSVVTAILAGAAAWFGELERVERTIVSLAIEESEQLLRHFGSVDLSAPDAGERANAAADAIVGGLFDIAEIYTLDGTKLAEATTAEGHGLEASLPKHDTPTYNAAFYEAVNLPNDVWAIRVFVPLFLEDGDAVTGYFEGVRLVPDWQQQDVTAGALSAAGLAVIAVMICGGVIFPIVTRLAADNQSKAREILGSHIGMMESFGRAIAKRDSDTGDHNYRVAWIAARIGEEMGLSETQMKALIMGSFLHDVGKIAIPDAILLKPGKLDEDEFKIMRTHVSQGEEIVRGIGWLEGANEIVAAHHEKWNGTGYPRGMKETGIPIAARIFAVADVFDALCSKRPYKDPMPFEKAMAILDQDSGTHFDPKVIAVFQSIAENIRRTLDEGDGQEAHVRALLDGMIGRYFTI